MPMIGFVISDRTWNIIQWPVIVIGLLWAFGLMVGLLYLLFRVVRRWPPMPRGWRVGRFVAEAIGVAAVLSALWFGGRVAP
jgi:hypothetical protein